MNKSIVFYILGWIMIFEGALMALPLGVSLLYSEKTGALGFLISMAICVVLGVLMIFRKPKNNIMYLREGFVITALGWICLSIMGSLPFIISGSISNPIDAIFETVSGFTTTGASILADVESLPKGIIFWRSFTHWIGGMGVLVFLLMLKPLSGASNVNLMKAESPGPQVEKLAPKLRTTARILYGIYIVMTIIQVVLLLVGKMPVFDAVTTALGTAGTGGFGIKNDSIASYSPYLQNVVTVFMILFGVNFSFYFLILQGKLKRAVIIEEVRWYFVIILSAITLIAINTNGLFESISDTIRHAAFQVGSVITTTGFATTDFNLWPQTSKTILVILMFIGACAGSTGGGFKVSRLVILVKTFHKELKYMLHPQNMSKVKMDGKTVSHEVVRMTNVFFITYVLVFAVSVLLISIENKDLVTTFTSVAATFNNIGPGLEMVGPTQNFGHFSVFSKLVFIFDMLAGRLELFPLLLIFKKETWQKF